MLRRLLITGAFVVCAAAANAATVEKATEPIRVDAVLDEAAWQNATPLAVAHEWFPGDNIPAAVKTDALITWDDDRLYVAFRAFDPNPRLIRARFGERDSQLQDDTVGILIDPFNDDRRAYQFRVNPLGVQADAINSDVEGSEDFFWDAVWESAGRVTEDGYIVEMAIPLQQLRLPTGGGPQTWGIMAMRDWPRDVRHRFRSVVTDENRNCLICQFQDVGGFRAATIGRNLEITPTLTGLTRDDRSGFGSPLANTDRSIEPGVSARWGITSGTSLQATLNPDFSQVEADAAALDFNTRFATSFPEKRPFFLEGGDFFETQMPLVFTRTIADPVAGLKLTGKSGAHSYGALFARDRITNLLIPFDDRSVRNSIAGESNTAVLRYRGEMGSRATAGGLVSSRSAGDYSNLLVSGDSFFRLTEQDSLRVQLAGSRTRYPDSTGSFDGHGFLASLNHADRNNTYGAAYEEYAPGFRADAGLFNQVGVRAAESYYERRVRGGPDRWFSNLYFGLSGNAVRQWDGDWNEWGIDVTAVYQGPRQSVVELLLWAPNQEQFDGRNYNNTRHNVFASIQAMRDLSVEMGVNWGETIDFSANREAEFITLTPGATFNIGRRMAGSISYAHQVFRTSSGERIFTADVPQSRLIYHFSGRSFARAILQYRSVDRVASKESSFLSQLLFSYRVNAQTVFLVGYSDNYAANDLVDMTQLNRTLFLKLGYAWLF